ncbi:MAG: hypothetical protein AAF434_16765 [Pseudomonadota bacterium]
MNLFNILVQTLISHNHCLADLNAQTFTQVDEWQIENTMIPVAKAVVVRAPIFLRSQHRIQYWHQCESTMALWMYAG